MWRLAFLIAAFVLYSFPQTSIAQDAPLKEDRKFLRLLDQFEKKWIGKPFPISLSSQKTYGGALYKSVSDKPIMVFVGSKGCPPCNAQLNFVQKMAIKNPQMNFVYLTSDITDTVRVQVKKMAYDALKTPNLQIVSVSQKTIEDSGIKDLGAPIKYYLDKNFKIVAVSALDRKDDAAISKEEDLVELWSGNLK